MNDLNLKINIPLPEVTKVITSEEAKSIYLIMSNNINIKTSNQNGDNNAIAGHNNFMSIVNKKIYWYGMVSGVIVSILVNLLSSFIYNYLIKIKL